MGLSQDENKAIVSSWHVAVKEPDLGKRIFVRIFRGKVAHTGGGGGLCHSIRVKGYFFQKFFVE